MTWLRAIPAALKLVPGWIWILLAVAAAFRFALAWHSSEVQATIAAAKTEQRAADQEEIAKAREVAIARKVRIETADASSAEKAKEGYAKDVHDLGAAYDELRRQPPPRVQPLGRGQGIVPGLAGDPVGAPAAAEGTDGRLSQGAVGSELAVVNWPELLEHGELCDFDRSRMTRLQDLVREIYANHDAP